MTAKEPTYTSKEIRNLATTINDAEGLKVLATLINDEMDLYSEDDMQVLIQASMIVFTRSLIIGSIKLLP